MTGLPAASVRAVFLALFFIGDRPCALAQSASSCGLSGEYSARRCGSSRAASTCNATLLALGSLGTLRCLWQEQCMMCLPPVGVLSSNCSLDGVLFRSDGGCPSPESEGLCGGCTELRTQQECIGLCSELCVWDNVSLLLGERCDLREQPVVEESYLLLYIAAGVGGLIAIAMLVALLHFLYKARKASLERQNRARLSRHLSQVSNRQKSLSAGPGAAGAFDMERDQGDIRDFVPGSSVRMRGAVSPPPSDPSDGGGGGSQGGDVQIPEAVSRMRRRGDGDATHGPGAPTTPPRESDSERS